MSSIGLGTVSLGDWRNVFNEIVILSKRLDIHVRVDNEARKQSEAISIR